MKIFEYLVKLREIEREYLPATHSLAERDLCLLVGLSNERGIRFSLKDIKSSEIASSATMERAVQKLVSVGTLRQTVPDSDRRQRELELNEDIVCKFARACAALALEQDINLEDVE